MKTIEYESGTVASYTEEEELERAVDAHLRTMDEIPDSVPHRLSGVDDGLREVAIEHLSHELGECGERGDYRVEEVVQGYASAESTRDTPDLDEGVE